MMVNFDGFSPWKVPSTSTHKAFINYVNVPKVLHVLYASYMTDLHKQRC